MRRINRFVIALVLLLCVAVWGSAEQAADKPAQEITILFTSDVHCGVDQNFGYAGLKAMKDALADGGNPVLLVDNGDSIQGGPIGTMTLGEADIALMNEMGYDVAIPGNHEFDYGTDRFLELAEMAQFPYISSNFRKNGELVLEPYVILEAGGVKIAFVGATTPETLTSTMPRYFQDGDGNYIYDFTQGNNGEDFYQAIQQAVDQARSEGARYVIALTHLGNESACEPFTYADLIAHTSGIDAVLDGHSHDMDKVVMQNSIGEKVIRQACGTRLEGIGWLRISLADGSMDTGLYTWDNDLSASTLLGIRNPVADQVEETLENQQETLSRVVGTAAVDLISNDPEATDGNGRPIRVIRMAETNLGDLCADAFRAAGSADVGLANSGGIFTGVPRGEITIGSIMGFYRYGNRLMTIEATGQQILDALEWGARAIPQENGAFLQVSGLTYEIHTYIESSCTADENNMFTGVAGERRVRNVMIGGEPLEPEKTYRVCSQSFPLIDGGDGQTAFHGAKVLWESDEPDYVYVADYISTELGGVVSEGYENPYGQERIVAVAEAGADAAGAALPELPEGVVPVTWDVTPEHLMIQTDEAREFYEQIQAGNYPTMEELREHPVVKQLDALSGYYMAKYGNTLDIHTPEREQMRQEKMAWFLSLGSARTESIDENGKHHYVYDGELRKEYQMELVLGLPASGKSTMIVDPDSEIMGAFVLDPDVIKAQLPEYIESHGAAASSIHFEGMKIFDDSIAAFTSGDMKGTNVILPIVGTDRDELLEKYIRPFEEAGYHVKVRFREAKQNEAAARVVMRELGGGQLIHSEVAFNFGEDVEKVYDELKVMTNSDGDPYGYPEKDTESADGKKVLPELPEGVVPVTWDVTSEHLMIQTDEARAFYEQVKAGNYPTMEELRAHPVVAQLDALAKYYVALYGNTLDINTPEREQLRQEKMAWFLSLGSARTESIDENGKHHYVYDGELRKEYQMELVLGLPASGKSTMIVDPDSEEMGAFVLDPDVIKAALPEYIESHGAGADAIHFEGMKIFDDSLAAFTSGDMKGTNIILPIVSTDLGALMERYITPFEEAGYRVRVKFREAKQNEAAARVVMRELEGGQLINSKVAFDFSEGVEDVYDELKDMINSYGEPYGYTEEEEEEVAPAA